MNCGPNGCGPSATMYRGVPVRAMRAERVMSPFAMFNEVFGPEAFGAAASEPRAESGGAMPVNVAETDTEVIVRALTPGFSKEQVEIEFEDSILTIRATPAAETKASTPGAAEEAVAGADPSKAERILRNEFGARTLARRLRFTMPIDSGKTQAELKDGVLTVRLSKVEEPKPTKIKIA